MPTATVDPGRTGQGDGPATVSPTVWWARSVPDASFVVFRAVFGLLVVASTVRFLARGWVGDFYLDPAHHLTYPRFEWVRPLPALAMYGLMALLAMCGTAIAAGRRYRTAAAVFAIGFAYTELLDAALYLNHYWFVTLAAVLLAVLPAPAPNGTVPAISVWALRGQLACVYLFAGIAKLNPDWLFHAQPLRIWLAARTDRPLIGQWLDEPAVAYLFSWAGAAFDLTIVGWLLWRRSRSVAYLAVVVFHLATAALFQIGVFPWAMIASTPIFFPPDWPMRWRPGLGRARSRASRGERGPVSRSRLTVTGALAVLNLVLPLRHVAASGDVRFNDDGYYLSWRVMLTERAAFVEYLAVDPVTGSTSSYRSSDVLQGWQAAQADTRPDLILATAHLVADDVERRTGTRPVVTVDAWVSVDGRPRQRWIDPSLDLATIDRTEPADRYVLAFEPPVTT